MERLQLSNQEFFELDLDTQDDTPIHGGGTTQAKFENHKMVIAMAHLWAKSDYNDAGSATIGFTQFVQNGQAHTISQGAIMGAGITELFWTFTVHACHAKASITIMTFD